MREPGRPSARLPIAAGAVLLAGALALTLASASRKSVTTDEVAHLPAGYSYLRTGEVVLNPMHPPLVKELCALPLLFLDVRMPADAETIARLGRDVTYQWEFGERFFVTQDAGRLLFWGRLPAIALWLALGILIARWASELWGPWGGLFSLFLYLADPTVTAHGQLITTDVGVAFFATLFLYTLRRHLLAPSGARLAAVGLTLGLALGAKFSAVALLPVGALLALLGFRDVPALGGERLRRLAALGFGALGIAAAVLWAIYLFPRDPFFYLDGIRALGADHNPTYSNLLAGELKPGGWAHYLLVAWLVKTPVASLAFLAAALVLLARGRRAAWLDEAFLLVPALVLFVGYSLTAKNIGVRYLIPVLPFLFIFAGRVAPALASAGRPLRTAFAVLAIWLGAEYALAWPNHISYFNRVAGGTRGGLDWLDDSNVDWGQGLIELREYLDGRGLERYHFYYFGTLDPGYYGVAASPMTLEVFASPPSGTVILSAHWVARGRAWLARTHGRGPGNWLLHRRPEAVVADAYYVYEIE